MVKKLFKHEFIYYFRTFGLFLPIVLAVGVMTRVLLIFDNGNIENEIAIGSSYAMLGVSCIALLLLSVVISVVRFYKNMYSAEGYLTFTLPITNASHIFVKIVVAMVCQALCLVTVIIAVLIALSGEPLANFFATVSYSADKFAMQYGTVNLIFIIAEAVLLLVLQSTSNMLLYYACITVGQTAKKNRIFMAVGAYFVYYVATQILATVFTIIVTVLGMAKVFDGIFDWISTHFIETIHIYLCFAIVAYAVMAAVFWLVTQTIMTKKLNLE